MQISPIIFDDLAFLSDFDVELTEKNLNEKIILLSICLFSKATEIRFLEYYKMNSQPKSN